LAFADGTEIKKHADIGLSKTAVVLQSYGEKSYAYGASLT
jgi:hypothetical protein